MSLIFRNPKQNNIRTEMAVYHFCNQTHTYILKITVGNNCSCYVQNKFL